MTPYSHLFKELDQLLCSYQAYWKFQPFSHQTAPWENAQLNDYLTPLSLKQIKSIETKPELIQQRFFPELAALNTAAIKSVSRQPLDTPFWLINGIKGRKAQQIQAFAEAVHPQQPILEWCSGKGHLGKVLNLHHRQNVTSVEWQASLCEAGQIQADKLQLQQAFKQADVLQGQADPFIKAQQHAVALHACGQLHLHLIKQVIKQQSHALSLCPCCYHLQTDNRYQPLSQTAKASHLQLTKQQLQFSVQQSVTGGVRVQRLRDTEQQWRLAYEQWRRQYCNDSEYKPLRSINKAWFSQGLAGFEQFFSWAAAQHKLCLPTTVNWQHWLEQGALRYTQVRQWELVRQQFQRPLELWLVLDRALALQEAGYQIQVEYLFDYSISPRNLLITAIKNC